MDRFFKAGGKSLKLNRTYIMGILNVTPDSFSDGGRYFDTESAVQHAKQMISEGADVIDVGAQSTRPGCQQITPDEEWSRLEPVLKELIPLDTVISVDTFFPSVAKKAIRVGAHIINDVHGFDSDMIAAVIDSGCGMIAVHPAGSAGGDIVSQVKVFFEEKYKTLENMGVDMHRVCFDPGIGFYKTQQQDLQLIANTQKLLTGGSAYLLALSKKRVISVYGGGEGLSAGTIAANTAGILSGADIIRVHDVAEAVQAARLADSIKGVI